MFIHCLFISRCKRYVCHIYRETVRGLRVGDSEERYLALYGFPSVRDEIVDDLLHIKIGNKGVTATVMGHYD
mgnify:FL=1